MKRVVLMTLRGVGLAILAILGLSLGSVVRLYVIPKVIADFSEEPAAATEDASGKKVAYWTSPMNPGVVSLSPGKGPMGMKLVPVYADQMGSGNSVHLGAPQIQNLGLRLAKAEKVVSTESLRSTGIVAYAEPTITDVTLKISGWIESQAVNYVGQRVSKGETLFTFYSPELVSTQEAFLLGEKQQEQGGDSLLGAASPSGDVLPAGERLEYWDVPQKEIEAIRELGEPKKVVAFESPADGWIVEKPSFAGSYVPMGQRLYRIADLSKVWVYVPLYQSQLSMVSVGDEATLTLAYHPNRSWKGPVTYIYPEIDETTRQVQVRLEFDNPELLLRPGMDADVTFGARPSDDRVLVPRDAVLVTGETRDGPDGQVKLGTAFVRVGPTSFEGRTVTWGADTDDQRLEITSGVKPGEQVVVTGVFGLNSEMRRRQASLQLVEQMLKQKGEEPEKKNSAE
ncbi:Cation efflux system protein CusB precursor [Planctomycetes bacterium Pan216]|uniref:Cation efflux system protein CusB n=1 Tax=Kolteria novifilia TaxID=2527975 RepID=A0A518B7R0_9BACT|nr:Cation efflux system protein CusB precursor [Planctomycetes bacterium Pan216]